MAEIETNSVQAEVTDINETPSSTPAAADVEEANESAELAKLRAEMARQKIALDKATKESADYKRQLRAKQSAEEVAAEEKRIADEARDAELAELRKRFAVAEASKKILAFVGDEQQSNSIAEALYGAADSDAAIDALNKAWAAKEKKLRQEYGKIPAPGIGSSDGPTVTLAQLNAMTYTERNDFAVKYPDEYNRLMGRS